MSDKPFEVIVISKVPKDSVSAFQADVGRVLDLLPDFDGVVNRRLRTRDGTTEILILNFVSSADYYRYLEAERASAAGQHIVNSLRADNEHIVVSEVGVQSALPLVAGALS